MEKSRRIHLSLARRVRGWVERDNYYCSTRGARGRVLIRQEENIMLTPIYYNCTRVGIEYRSSSAFE